VELEAVSGVADAETLVRTIAAQQQLGAFGQVERILVKLHEPRARRRAPQQAVGAAFRRKLDGGETKLELLPLHHLAAERAGDQLRSQAKTQNGPSAAVETPDQPQHRWKGGIVVIIAGMHRPTA